MFVGLGSCGGMIKGKERRGRCRSDVGMKVDVLLRLKVCRGRDCGSDVGMKVDVLLVGMWRCMEAGSCWRIEVKVELMLRLLRSTLLRIVDGLMGRSNNGRIQFGLIWRCGVLRLMCLWRCVVN